MAFGIVVGGILIAVWVLMSSFDLSGGESASRLAGGAQQGIDTRAFEANVAALMERVRQNPSDYSALVGLGNSYYDAGRWAEAVPWYERALQVNPEDTNVRTDLGTAHLYSGNPERAKQEWFKVLEQDPNKVETHYNLAVLYSQANPPDLEAAAREWETVIRVAPNSEQARQAEKQLKAIGKR